MAPRLFATRRELLLAVPLMLSAVAKAQEMKPAATLNLRRDNGLDKLLNQWREKEDIPAAYLALYYQGKFYGSVSGTLKRAADAPATLKNHFRIGSVTKPMTSTLE